MRIKLIQDIIDKLRGKSSRIYMFDKKVKLGKGTYVDNSSTIGDYTCLMEHCSVTRATIGRYCSIADFVTIGAGDHNIDKISTNGFLSNIDSNELTEKPVTIGNDVWIGVDSIIRRGVNVGNCAVIGANSFVNKDVPDFAVVAGNPAKIIKYRFDEATREKIQNSKYWEYEPAQAREMIQTIEKERE